MGSKSDHDRMKACCKKLEDFGVAYELIVSSAHRSPQRTKSYVEDAQDRGAGVFICAAGMAAHLAGAVAAMTVRPVIGVPIASGALGGLDALHSTVQMPSGIPVATVAVDGGTNSAFLAMQILALSDENLTKKLLEDRRLQEKKVIDDSKDIEKLSKETR